MTCFKLNKLWVAVLESKLILCDKIYVCIGKYTYFTELILILEKARAPHPSTLAWKIPWTEEPGRLQSMGSRRVGHDWATSLSVSCIGEGNGNPLQCSCLENPRDGGAWWAAVYGVALSWTRLKQLSSSNTDFTKLILILNLWFLNNTYFILKKLIFFTYPLTVSKLQALFSIFPFLLTCYL